MIKQLKIAGAALFIVLGATSTAFAGLPMNGPDLDGTRVGAQTEAFNPETVLSFFGVGGGGTCQPWQCGVNGPDLDGTRVHMRIQNTDPIALPTKEFQGIGNCEPWQCGVNGPDLDGTRINTKGDGQTKSFSSEIALLTFNGPDLSGTRADAVAPKTLAVNILDD